MDIDWIREGLKKPGKTQRGLADALGTDPAAISRLLKGERQLKAHEIGPAATYLSESPPAQLTNTTPRFSLSSGQTDKIPVLGIAEGGDEGWSLWNGEVVDYITRPPFLAGATQAYAVYVTGSSMEPRYFPGELIYIHPGKPVTVGSFVLVQTRPRAEGEPPRALIARLEKRTLAKITMGKLNPSRVVDVPAKDIVSVHRIVGSGE